MAMDEAVLIPAMKSALKSELIIAFNLQPGGYNDAYLDSAMNAFAKAICHTFINHIQTYADVNPVKDVSNKLIAGGVDVTGKGGIA